MGGSYRPQGKKEKLSRGHSCWCHLRAEVVQELLLPTGGVGGWCWGLPTCRMVALPTGGVGAFPTGGMEVWCQALPTRWDQAGLGPAYCGVVGETSQKGFGGARAESRVSRNYQEHILCIPWVSGGTRGALRPGT